MWPRVVEFMLAMWLALSPFIFPGGEGEPSSWLLYLLAAVVGTLALLSYWPPTGWAHLVTIAVAVGMCLWGRFATSPPGAGHQNLIAVGLLLIMFAIIPNDCLRPPKGWRMEDLPSDEPVVE